MAKKALIVGINYPGTSHELRGCVNDANLMNSVITENYGFSNVRMLLDNDATTANMLAGLEWLVNGAVPGDVLYFHYSGHGSQMYDQNGEEADGLDEIICPVDLDWNTKVIRDDDLKRIFEKVPNGVNLTVTLDCCNSGGGLDQANQYQSLGLAERAALEEAQKDGRFLPPPENIALMEGKIAFKPRALQRNVDASGMLISGCQAHQTSADAYINGRYIGACTFFLAESLKLANWGIQYKSLVDTMNGHMVNYGYTQRPELNGPTVLFEKEFLQQYVEYVPLESGIDSPDVLIADPIVADIVEPVTEILIDTPPPEKKDKKKVYIAIAIVAVAALFFILS